MSMNARRWWMECACAVRERVADFPYCREVTEPSAETSLWELLHSGKRREYVAAKRKYGGRAWSRMFTLRSGTWVRATFRGHGAGDWEELKKLLHKDRYGHKS